MSNDEGEDIIERLRKGEIAALAALISAVGADLHQHVAKQLTGRYAALREDAVQETFIAVWRHVAKGTFPNFLSVGRFVAWLKRIAYRVACNAINTEKKQPPVTEADGIDARTASPVEAAECGELDDETRVLIAELPKNQRDVIELSLQGYEPKEIAVLLGVRDVTVRSRLSRARQHLHDRMTQRLGNETFAGAPEA